MVRKSNFLYRSPAAGAPKLLCPGIFLPLNVVGGKTAISREQEKKDKKGQLSFMFL